MRDRVLVFCLPIIFLTSSLAFASPTLAQEGSAQTILQQAIEVEDAGLVQGEEASAGEAGGDKVQGEGKAAANAEAAKPASLDVEPDHAAEAGGAPGVETEDPQGHQDENRAQGSFDNRNHSPLRSGSGWPIGEGNEHLVIALIEPFKMEDEIKGAKVGDIEINPYDLRFFIEWNGKRAALKVTQKPLLTTEKGKYSQSFVFEEQCPGACPQEALDALREAISQNDDGTFWRKVRVPAVPGTSLLGQQSKLFWLLIHHFRDGFVQFVFVLFLLLFILWRQLFRNEDALRTLAFLALLIGLGVILRYFLAVEAPMTAWPYSRLLPLTQSIWVGEWFQKRSLANPESVIRLADFNHQINFMIAVLTPLVLFAHARYLLSNNRQALMAVFLLVILPMHIRFSRADVIIVQSLAMASLTFTAIYTALLDRSVIVRLFFLLLIPTLSILTYRIRPEAFGLSLVDLAGVYIIADKGVPRRRQLVVGSVVLVTAVYVFFSEFILSNQAQVSEGLSFGTLLSTVYTLFNLRLNTLANPFVTPPWIPLLAALGFFWLWKDGQKKRALFLLGWLGTFLFIHSVIQGVTAMQARYHLQLVTPFVMLAAASTPIILSWKRQTQLVLVGLLLLSPFLYFNFIRDTNYYVMQEYRFLQEASKEIPDGCTVLEFSPAVVLETPEDTHASRLQRFGLEIKHGREEPRFTVLQSGLLMPDTLDEVPTRQAQDLMKNPPSCLFLYEGLSCRSHRPLTHELAPTCETLRDMAPEREVIAEATITGEYYDFPFLGRISHSGKDRQGVLPGTPVNLHLYRIPKPPPQAAETGQ